MKTEAQRAAWEAHLKEMRSPSMQKAAQEWLELRLRMARKAPLPEIREIAK